MDPSLLEAFGKPPEPDVSSDDEGQYEPVRPPAMPAELFGFPVSRVTKQDLFHYVVERFSLYPKPAALPAVPARWGAEADAAPRDGSRGAAAGQAAAPASAGDEAAAAGALRPPAWLASAMATSGGAADRTQNEEEWPECFAGAGEAIGTDIWRIEKMTPVRVPLEDHGKFYKGDAYIVLHTVDQGARLGNYVYSWVGAHATIDESLSVDFSGKKLAKLLRTSYVREEMGLESKPFRDIFWFGFQLLDGGIDSGLRAVAKRSSARLFKIKGRETPICSAVRCHFSSLANDDVFLLDTGELIYHWIGARANNREKGKALDALTVIRGEERGGRCRVELLTPVTQFNADFAQFWALLDAPQPYGPATCTVADDGETDEAHEARLRSSLRLLKVVQSATGSLALQAEEARPIKQRMLDTAFAYILDSPTDVFVWIGKQSSDVQRAAAMKVAQVYAQQQQRPPWMEVTRVVEGAETFLFKENFAGWHRDKARAQRAKLKSLQASKREHAAAGRERSQAKKIDLAAVARQPAEPMEGEVTDDPGGGQTTLMVLQDDTRQFVLPPALRGHFFDADVTLILYVYTAAARDGLPPQKRCVIYFWQGAAASNKVWLSFGQSELRKRLGDMDPLVVRCFQMKETEHLKGLFDGRMIVHRGHYAEHIAIERQRVLQSRSAWFAALQDLPPTAIINAAQLRPAGARLFQVRGWDLLHMNAWEISPLASALNSNDAFVLVDPDTRDLFVWRGLYSTESEEKMAAYVGYELACIVHADSIAAAERAPGAEPDAVRDAVVVQHVRRVAEGNEPPGFWAVLGGRQPYYTTDTKNFEPRLFLCTRLSGELAVSLVPHFSQRDLTPRQVLILDCFTELFVWVGSEAVAADADSALDLAREFVARAVDGRGSCAIARVDEFSEPAAMTRHFADWHGRPRRVFRDPRDERAEALQRELKRKRRLVLDCLKNAHCTFAATSFDTSIEQKWCECRTCGLTDGQGVCWACRGSCHAGHVLGPMKTSEFFCACGSHVVASAPACRCLVMPPQAPAASAASTS